MKITFIVFLFFFNSAAVFCQSLLGENHNEIVENFITRGDSLKKIDKIEALASFKEGLAMALDNNLNEQAVVFYKKIGALYHRQREYAQAELMYRKGLSIDSISSVAADLNYNISLLKSVFNQQDSLFVYLKRSVNLYEGFTLNNSSYKAFLKAGVVYKDRQLYDEALKYSIKAFNGFKKNGNKQKLANACTNIGNIQNQLQNHNQALIYHYKALKIERELNNKLGKGICYTNIANAYDDLKSRDSAIVNYKRALRLFDINSSQYAILLNNLAITYKSIGKHNESKQYFVESIEANKSLRDTISLLYNYDGIASLYLEYFDIRKVRYYLNRAKEILPSVTDQRAILSYYENEIEYHDKKGQYKKALEFYHKYSNLYKKIYNSEQTKLVQNLQNNFDNQIKENKILTLNLANKNATLLLAKKNENIKGKNSVVVILLIVVVLMVVVYQNILQQQKTTIQKAKLVKLEAIYDGQETIKKRVARDLHDIITTNFDGLRLRILALKRSSDLSETIDIITDDLKKMNQQIRTVSHRLYPLEMYMDKQKFVDIIKSRLSEFQLYGNVFVELENQLPKILNMLPIEVQNNFYGILLEILNNVEKHAHATKITIKNYKDNIDYLHFIFEDNGIGIVNSHKEGIGIMNIKQRVEILEGSCTICKIESGTQVHINFPIKKYL